MFIPQNTIFSLLILYWINFSLCADANGSEKPIGSNGENNPEEKSDKEHYLKSDSTSDTIVTGAESGGFQQDPSPFAQVQPSSQSPFVCSQFTSKVDQAKSSVQTGGPSTDIKGLYKDESKESIFTRFSGKNGITDPQGCCCPECGSPYFVFYFSDEKNWHSDRDKYKSEERKTYDLYDCRGGWVKNGTVLCCKNCTECYRMLN